MDYHTWDVKKIERYGCKYKNFRDKSETCN
jgi:hypothetical protein